MLTQNKLSLPQPMQPYGLVIYGFLLLGIVSLISVVFNLMIPMIIHRSFDLYLKFTNIYVALNVLSMIAALGTVLGIMRDKPNIIKVPSIDLVMLIAMGAYAVCRLCYVIKVGNVGEGFYIAAMVLLVAYFAIAFIKSIGNQKPVAMFAAICFFSQLIQTLAIKSNTVNYKISIYVFTLFMFIFAMGLFLAAYFFMLEAAALQPQAYNTNKFPYGQRQMPGQPMPGQPMPGQRQMPGQPMPGQPMPGRPMPGQLPMDDNHINNRPQ